MNVIPRARLGGTAAMAALAALLSFAPLEALAVATASAVLASIVVWPELGLALAALGVPFAGLISLPTGTGAVTLTPLVLIAAGLGWVVLVLSGFRRTAYDPLMIAALAFLLGALGMATWRAPDAGHAVFEVARWIELGLALVLASSLYYRPRSRSLVLLAVLAAGTASGAVGIKLAIDRVGPEAFAILGGRLYRAHGTFGQPNPFGAYMNMVWPVGASVAAIYAMRLLPFTTRGRNHRVHAGRSGSLGWTAVGALTACTAIAALALSWSRGAWLAAAAAGMAMAIVYVMGAFCPNLDVRRLFVVLLGIALVLALLLGGLADRLPGSVADRLTSVAGTFVTWNVGDVEVTDDNFATVERVAHWQAAAAMWADRPWLGQGPGHYELVYGGYRLPRWSEPLGHAHNYYLHTLAESGLVGLAGYLTFLGLLLAAAVKAALRPKTTMQAALGLGLVGVLTSVGVHSLTDNVFVHETTVHIGLLAGLTYAAGGAGRHVLGKRSAVGTSARAAQ